MNCEQARERIPDYLTDTLDATALADFQDHLANCAGCRQDAAGISRTWEALGLLEPEEPGPELRRRFYQSLESYQQGLAGGPGNRPARLGWWPRQPVLQLTCSALLLIAGVVAGYWIALHHRGQADLSQLQGEVRTMRQMVTLSLLQQQSASERLRGVDWSARADQSDTQVLAALLYAVNYDPSVNVRLAAVDALRKFSGIPMVSQALDQTLTKQDSPLVQIALIDLLVDLRERQSAPALRSLLVRQSVNPEVKERAKRGLLELR